MKKFGFKVGELKRALEGIDDDTEIFIANSFNVCGNISELCEVRKDTYSFFGCILPCVILDSAQNVSFEEDKDEYIEELEAEIEQYKAIGTVEEVKQMSDELKRWHTDGINKNIKNPFVNTFTSICHNCDHKDEYIEELEAEIEQYKAIGMVDECREAVEKQKVKKYERGHGFYVKCPVCETFTTDTSEHRHCVYCGQRLE